ncbi:hypothetical protein BY996DRAFT_7588658 [Phakopsora pachyrhizi]|uniref:Expressed protein n=1 Tax=Phakopsora pachyrhizi TaxID=170000 RepID=A0AAV0AR52_PHAPC|nr:hypothetical protein BY996DRAFT_7588658 [Phakopsora pachyrhizi]CAH7670803.1 expressed protein [Phakopsora pachyrhizi]
MKKSYHHLKSNKVLGTTILPVTRVTRAAKQDKDIKIVSKEAIFLISIATEFFIRKLTDSGFDHAKKEKRVFVKYNDIAKAIKSNDEYQWLEEVIPVSRPLGAILSDPTIPSASTAITNQLPQFLKRPDDKLNNNDNTDGIKIPKEQDGDDWLQNEQLSQQQQVPSNLILNNNTNNSHSGNISTNHSQVVENMSAEIDEDELDEDL